MPSRVNKNKVSFLPEFSINSVCHHQWQENEKKREDRDTQRVEEGEAENRTEQDPRRVGPPLPILRRINYITATLLIQDPRYQS